MRSFLFFLSILPVFFYLDITIPFFVILFFSIQIRLFGLCCLIRSFISFFYYFPDDRRLNKFLFIGDNVLWRKVIVFVESKKICFCFNIMKVYSSLVKKLFQRLNKVIKKLKFIMVHLWR